MSETLAVDIDLELSVTPATTNTLRQVNTLMLQSASLLRRMGFSEDVNRSIADFQRLLMIVNRARLALMAFQAARLAAGDPIAWGLAIVAGGNLALDVVSA